MQAVSGTLYTRGESTKQEKGCTVSSLLFQLPNSTDHRLISSKPTAISHQLYNDASN